MPKVMSVMLYGFCSKFEISFTFQQCKNFEKRLRFDKDTEMESSKVGTFFRHSVVSKYW